MKLPEKEAEKMSEIELVQRNRYPKEVATTWRQWRRMLVARLMKRAYLRTEVVEFRNPTRIYLSYCSEHHVWFEDLSHYREPRCPYCQYITFHVRRVVRI